MKVNFYDLNGRYECSRRRKYEYGIKEAENQVAILAKAQKELLCKAITGVLPVCDIGESVNQVMENIPYRSRKGRELMEEDITFRLIRAANDFLGHVKGSTPWDTFTQLPEIDIKVSVGEEPVTVTGVHPDILTTYSVDNVVYVNAFFIRIGKPKRKDGRKYTARDASEDKQLFTLLLYAKRYAAGLVPHGEKTVVSAKYIFLRKDTDKYPTVINPEAHFDRYLFCDDEGKPTDNIVGITDIFVNEVDAKITNVDASFAKVFNSFIDGLMPDECSAKQCSNCELDELCHYTHAPLRLSEKPSSGPALRLIHLSGVQEKIQLFNTGYAVVNAVPGAGKTLVLVLRIIEILNSGVNPDEIAIITFTNSGAEVFKNRISVYNGELGNGDPVDGMTATTFNGLGQSILEREYKSMGFSRPPRVIDPVERSAIIADLLNRYEVPGLDYRNFTMDMKNGKGALAVASSCFQAMKQNGWTQFDAEKIVEKLGRFCSIQTAEALAVLFDEYCDYLKERSLVEYADQEVLILDMLQRNPYYFDSYGWKHIMVDECQDTSENQFKLLKYMTQTTSFESCMVVGDDSQSIYGFRDTSPKFFMNFEDVMGLKSGTVQQFYMTDNFRSTPEIVSFANQIIKQNRWKVAKEIVSKNPSGCPVIVKGFLESQEEYSWIVDMVSKKIQAGIAMEDIAFIASTRTEILKMADLLTMEGIDSVILTPERYVENSRVRAAIALARYFQDEDGTKNILIYLNAILGGDTFLLSEDQVKEQIEKKRAQATEIKSLPEASFREEYFKLLNAIDEDDEVYQSFIRTLSSQPDMQSIFTYCEDYSIYGEKAEKRRDHSYPGVALTTAHSSKGMEWPVIFNSISKYDVVELQSSSLSMEQIEERRRLLFVSATRARDELYITGKYVAYGGQKEPHFNQFLDEAYTISGHKLDKELVINEMKERSAAKRKASQKTK